MERWWPDDQLCSIITTQANGLVQSVHNRMPAIIDSDYYSAWLDRDERDPAEPSKLLEPYSADLMKCSPASKRVNDIRNDDAECVATLNTDFYS